MFIIIPTYVQLSSVNWY